MSKNMNTAPAFPDPNTSDASGGWSQMESGLIVPESVATQTANAEAGTMTRDERIADGKEKAAALKAKAKDGLVRMMQSLKDRFYTGVSRGAESAERIAEKAGRAKEKIGDTLTTARNKAAELFNKGREYITQKASEASARKEARQRLRQERAEKRDAAQRERAAAVKSYRRAEKRDKADNAADEQLIKANEQNIARLNQDLKAENEELAAAKDRREKLEKEARKAAEEAEVAKKKAEDDPTDERLRLEVEEKVNLSNAANAALEIANFDVSKLEKDLKSINSKINRAEVGVNKAQERIKDRAEKAKARKDRRRQDRREALGGSWESAKDKIRRVADKSADWMKRLGRKISLGVGKVARKVANKLDPVESDGNK